MGNDANGGNRGFAMLTKIETRDTITRYAATRKYRTKYILMVIVETIDNGDNDLGYVIYTADREKDFDSVSIDEFADKKIAYLIGGAAEPYPTIGNVVYHA